MNNKEIQDTLQWRYATKAYDSHKKISPEDWNTLKAAMLKAPSSYGLQPWKFLIIENPELRKALRPATWNQSAVTDADRYIVFLTKNKVSTADVQKYMDRIVEVRGVSLESLNGFQDMLQTNVVEGKTVSDILSWTQKQAYIAIGFLLETAALLKIDATPIEGMEPESYDKILNLEGTPWRTAAAVALGYRDPQDAYQNIKKVRFLEQDIFEYR